MSQVLSQNEVDALLSAVSDNRVDTEEDDAGGDLKSGVVQYDLANQDRIIRGAHAYLGHYP